MDEKLWADASPPDLKIEILDRPLSAQSGRGSSSTYIVCYFVALKLASFAADHLIAYAELCPDTVHHMHVFPREVVKPVLYSTTRWT